MNSRPTASPAYSYAPGPMDCLHFADYMNAKAPGCRRDVMPEDYRRGAKAREPTGDRPEPTGDRPELTGDRPGLMGGRRGPMGGMPGLEPELCCCSGPPPSQESTTKLKPKARLCLRVSHSSSFTSRQSVVPTTLLHSNSVRNRELREIAEIISFRSIVGPPAVIRPSDWRASPISSAGNIEHFRGASISLEACLRLL